MPRYRYAPYGQRVVAAFDLKKKNIKWISALYAGFGFSVLAGDEIFIESGKGGAAGDALQSMDAATGRINWSWTPENGEKLYARSFPVVTNNLVFVNGYGKIYAISRKTRQKVWSHDGMGTIAMGNHVLFITNHTYRKVPKSEYFAVNGLSVTAIGF